MRVRTKLVALTLFVAVVPLAISAFQGLRIHDRALTRSLLQLHDSTARFGATTAKNYLDQVRASLQTMVQQTISWSELSPEETTGALWLVYGQFDTAQIVQMSDEGKLWQVYLDEPDPARPRRRVLGRAAAVEFADRAPAGGPRGAVGAGLSTQAGTLVPISIADAEGTRTVTVGLDLGPLCEQLERLRPDPGRISLFGSHDEPLCNRDASEPAATAELRRILHGAATGYERTEASTRLRGALAATSEGWHVTVEQPLSVMTRPTQALQRRSLLWVVVGAAAALVGGLILSRGIHQPLEELARGAQEIGEGNLSFRLATATADEFGELSHAFNTMSEEVAKRDAEIRRWNEELVRRVDERSRELEKANRALLRTRKMAGLSALTAGVAHEMNNPLTGILGLTQVLVSRSRRSAQGDGNAPLLESIVKEARRMQSLLEKMMSLRQLDDGNAFHPVRLEPLLQGIVIADKQKMGDAKVEVVLEPIEQGLRVLGDQRQLTQVFRSLFENAKNAIAEVDRGGGRVKVTVSRPEADWVRIRVEDDGPGIRDDQLSRVVEPFFTTKPGGAGEGLGLTRAHQIVEGHGGTLDIHSEWGSGTRVDVVLPAAGTEAHLV